MSVVAPLDVSRIYRSPVLRSRSSLESQRALSAVLSEHHLRWGRGEVSTTLHRLDFQRISAMILSHGAEVEVTPAPFEDFALVQLPLRGTVEIEADGTSLRADYGEMVVLSPRERLRLLWRPGCEQLIIKLPHGLVQGATVSPWRQPVSRVAPAVASQWLTLLQQLVTLSPGAGQHAMVPSWIAPFEEAAALFLHSHQLQDAGVGAGAGPGAEGCDPEDSDADAIARLQRLEAFVRSRPFAPLTLADLARVAGVATRTLNTFCHRYRGVSPMGLLRDLRLEGARDQLLSRQDASITEIAMDHGFAHLGRFSAYYRERFGELPRQTGKQA